MNKNNTKGERKMKMNKSDVIADIANHTGVSKVQTEKVVEGFIATVRDALASGGSVSVSGLGKFEMRSRAAKDYTNPKTGQHQPLAPTTRPAFSFSGKFKNNVKK